MWPRSRRGPRATLCAHDPASKNTFSFYSSHTILLFFLSDALSSSFLPCKAYCCSFPPLPLRGEKRNIPYHFPLLPSFPPAASASSYNARLFPTSPRDPWRKDSRALIFREISFSPPPPVSCRGRSNTLLSFGGILALANQPCKGRGEEEGGSFACPSPPFLPLSLGATVEGRRRSNRDGYTAILALSLLLTTLQHMPNEV